MQTMSKKIKERLGNAVLQGWGFARCSFPRVPESRGTLWICRPDGPALWMSHKNSGKRWLESILDGAGVPNGEVGRARSATKPHPQRSST